jgi:hypothetical protein
MTNLEESKKRLQENFIFLRKLNNDLLNDLSDYSAKYNVSNKIFMKTLLSIIVLLYWKG